MKKLLLAFAACAFGVVANAGSIYCVGGGKVDGKTLPGSPNGNCVEVTSETNEYTFTVSDCTWLKISDVNGTNGWNGAFNANGFCVQDKGDYTLSESDLGKSLTIWYGSSLNITPPSKDEYIYKLTVGNKNSNQSRLVVTAKGNVEITYEVYLRNSTNDYAATAANKFTTQDQVNYTLTNVTMSAGTQFKLADADWGSVNFSTQGEIYPNISYTLTNGAYNNMTLMQDITNATITFNRTTGAMYINDPTAVTPDKEDYTIYFDNTDNWDAVYIYTWNPELAGGYPGTELQKNDEGLYYWTYSSTVKPSFEGFNFNDGKGSDEAGQKKTNDIFNYEVGATYYPNGTTTPPTGETNYTTWYVGIAGSFNNNDFYEDGKIEAQPNAEGLATIENVPIGSGNFMIKVWPGGGSDSYYSNGTNAVAVGSWVQLSEANDTYSPVEGSTSNSVYKVEFDCTNNKVMLTLTSGGTTDPETPEYPANLYLLGNIGQVTNTWVTDYEFNNDGNGSYTATGVAFYPPTEDGQYSYAGLATADNWDAINNGNRYGPGAEDVEITDGVGMSFTQFSGNSSWKLPIGIYTVTVSWDKMTITFKKTGNLNIQTPDLPTTMYIIGSYNDGDIENSTAMTSSESGVFSVSNITLGDKNWFAFTSVQSADWNIVNANRWGPKDKDTEASIGENDVFKNGDYDTSWNIQNGTYDFTLDLNTMKLTVAAALGTEIITYQLAGPIFPDNTVQTASMTENAEDGTYTCTAIVVPQAFKINKLVNGVVTSYFAAPTNAEAANEITAFKSYNGVENGPHNWVLSGVVCNTAPGSPLTFVFDPETATLTVEGPVLYLRGDMNGWGTTMPFTFNTTDKNFTINISDQKPITAGQKFKFADASYGTLNYGASEAATTAENVIVKTIELAKPGNDIVLDSDFHGIITVNINATSASATFTQNTTDGVAGIEAADETEAVYYNLQGVKVANPDRGIFVKVQNGKAVKVVK